MENFLKGQKKTVCFLDNILIGGTFKEDLLKWVERILTLLQDAGLKLKKEKCEFLLNEVKYLGLKINQHGILQNEDKLKSIDQIKVPENITEVKSYLGMINFYHRFIANAATVFEVINKLLRDNQKWI